MIKEQFTLKVSSILLLLVKLTFSSLLMGQNSIDRISVYAPSEGLFGNGAIDRGLLILESGAQQNPAQNFALTFGVAILPPFNIESYFSSEELSNKVENFSPKDMIRDSLELIKESYNNKLIAKYISENSGFSSQTHILIFHNIFVYPYSDSSSLVFVSKGYYSTGNVLNWSDFDICGALSPANDTITNNRYLLSLINSLIPENHYHDNNGVYDRTLRLNAIQLDSIGLMRDTIEDEREWTIVVDIIDTICGTLNDVLIDTTTTMDTIQLVFQVSEVNGELSFEMNIFVSDNISHLLPQRFRNYVRDSVGIPLLNQDSLYRAIIKSIERFRRPLPGDMFFEMRVVHTAGSPNSGGMFGCARNQPTDNCATSSIPNLHMYAGRNKVHNGLDMFADLDTDIFAMYDGTVQFVENSVPANTEGTAGDFGNRVRLRHTWAQYGGQSGDPDIYTYYTHLNSVETLAVGNVVRQGQKLGETGRTGNAFGIEAWRYHSHICVYSGGTAASDLVTPRPYFYTQFDLYGVATN